MGANGLAGRMGAGGERSSRGEKLEFDTDKSAGRESRTSGRVIWNVGDC
jgi:hypothetical protein